MLSVQSLRTMDTDVRARDLINRAELFKNRKVQEVRRRLDFGGEAGVAGDSSPHSLAVTMEPNMEDLSSKQARDLQEKYNFNFVEEEKQEGPFEWEKITETSNQSKDVPEYYFRMPHKKKVRRISPEVLEASRSSPKDASQNLLLGKGSSSLNGSNSTFRLPTTTPVTRQLFSGEKETGSHLFSSMAGTTPQTTTTTCSSAGDNNDAGSNMYTSFITGTHDDLTKFSDSILSFSSEDSAKEKSAIMHKPLPMNGRAQGDQITGEEDVIDNVTEEELASATRYQSQGNNNGISHMDSCSQKSGVDELVSVPLSHSLNIPVAKTPPPDPGTSISSEESSGDSQPRDETPSTSGMGGRKRTGDDIRGNWCFILIILCRCLPVPELYGFYI